MRAKCLLTCSLLALAANAVPYHKRDSETCRKTSVAVLGAGVAGIEAAKTLSKASVEDFLIIEYNGEIGGRVKHTNFGKQRDGSPYTIELGANWVQGLVTPPGPENPIWTLAKEYHLKNTYSNYSSMETFTEEGAVDYLDLFDKFDDDYSTVEQDAGYILTESLKDRTFRSGFDIAGWKPEQNKKAEAVEWFEVDFEYAYSPEECSDEFAIVNYNTTFYQYSDANNYVYDQRGFNAFIKGEASTFLEHNDPRLLFNTIVTDVTYSDDGVTIHNEDGSCIKADYAICTFSLGVLQHEAVTFTPTFPLWKRQGIQNFQMGTYTKIFLQFPPDKVFWNTSTQFFLYADPHQRGYYPIFQSLDAKGFLPGSGIFFVTVVDEQSYAVEAQDDETTKAQVMVVLREMFGADKVPDPIAFLYPRWTKVPWAYGSYSNWPPGTSLEEHQNLRANVQRLYFAGEATSAEYYGFLHGAYFEGQVVGKAVADCVKGKKCEGEVHYTTLPTKTLPSAYDEANGWEVTSFQTNGL